MKDSIAGMDKLLAVLDEKGARGIRQAYYKNNFAKINTYHHVWQNTRT